MHGLEAKYQDQINFVYLDIDDPRNDDAMALLGYRYQPHLFLLDADGNIIQQFIGYTAEEVLEAAFISALE